MKGSGETHRHPCPKHTETARGRRQANEWDKMSKLERGEATDQKTQRAVRNVPREKMLRELDSSTIKGQLKGVQVKISGTKKVRKKKTYWSETSSTRSQKTRRRRTESEKIRHK